MGRVTVATATIAAATLIGATGLLLRPASTPEQLRTATELTSAPVGREDLTDERTVRLTLRRTAAPPLVVGFAGRVTASSCVPGRPLRSGQAVARIDNTPLIAVATSMPLYRDLGRGAKGRDVKALQRELARLGHRLTVDGVYSYRTAAAVKKLQKSAGVDSPDGAVDAGKVLWLPAPSVVPHSCELVRGAYVSSGATYAKVSARLTSIIVDSLPSNMVAGDRVLRAMGVTGPLNDDGLATDSTFLAKVAATQEYRLIEASGKEPELTGSVALTKPVPTVKVPPGALFGVDGDTGCVQSGPTGYPVRIVGSRLGATLVVPAAGTAAPATVNLGSSITLDSCG